MKTILIIEDDENLSRGIAFTFEKDGYHVLCARSIESGEHIFLQHTIDLIILDLGLPDGNGMDLCKKLRKNSKVPIIMLTACDLETDEVAGLLSGADDYITKPFSLSVLRMRVSVIFRRLEEKEPHIIRAGIYQIDTNMCKLYCEENEIPVTITEFKLIHYLMNNAGQILSKEQILSALWDTNGNFVDENTLSVNISRLRSKIEPDPKKPKTIKTIHGMGYVWVKE